MSNIDERKKCIVCKSKINISVLGPCRNGDDHPLETLYDEIFEVFCNYFNLNESFIQQDGEDDKRRGCIKTVGIPFFCVKCANKLTKLTSLHRQLEGLQSRIQKIVGSVAYSIIKSTHEKEEIVINYDDERTRQVSLLRSTVCQQFNPKLYLTDITINHHNNNCLLDHSRKRKIIPTKRRKTTINTSNSVKPKIQVSPIHHYQDNSKFCNIQVSKITPSAASPCPEVVNEEVHDSFGDDDDHSSISSDLNRNNKDDDPDFKIENCSNFSEDSDNEFVDLKVEQGGSDVEDHGDGNDLNGDKEGDEVKSCEERQESTTAVASTSSNNNSHTFYHNAWPITKSNGTYICDTCGHCETECKIIHRHIRENHPGENQIGYVCSTCGRQFKLVGQFMHHQRVTHDWINLKSMTLTLGNGSFVYDGLWYFGTVEYGFECRDCGLVLNSVESMVDHIKFVHAIEAPTTSSNKKIVNGGRRIIKDLGNGLFLYRGKWNFELLDDGKYKCVCCGHTTTSWDMIGKHISRTHFHAEFRSQEGNPTNVSAKNASRCTIRKREDGKFTYGDWVFYLNPVNQMFTCETCEKCYTKNCHLFSHIRRRHMDSNRFICDTCGHGCCSQSRLRRHQVVHSKERNYTCEQCGRSFKLAVTLRMHLKSHATIFKCHVCGKILKSKNSLLYHVKIHTRAQKNDGITERTVVHDYDCDVAQEVEVSMMDISPDNDRGNNVEGGSNGDRSNEHQEYQETVIVQLVQCTDLVDNPTITATDTTDSSSSRTFYHKFWPIEKLEDVYTCKTCEHTESDRTKINRHIRKNHPGQNKMEYECLPCEKEFNSVRPYIEHQRVNHYETNLKSVTLALGNGFFVYHGRWYFSTVEHGLECRDCALVLNSVESMIQHIESIHARQRDTKKKRRRNVIQDLGNGHFIYRGKWSFEFQNGKFYKCTSCGHMTKNWEMIGRHIQRVHFHGESTPPPQKVVNVKEIKRRYTAVRLLEDGKFSFGDWVFYQNTENQMFTCDSCGKGYTTKDAIRGHIRDKHMDVSRFVCDVCGRGYAMASRLQQHKLAHSDVKDHSCEYCGQAFKLRGQLNSHLTTHSTIFKCHICEKVLKDKAGLHHHLKTHSTAKDFLCTKCPKTFRDNTNLNRHLRRHENRVRLPCSFCDKQFLNKVDLKKHLNQKICQKKKNKSPSTPRASSTGGSKNVKRRQVKTSKYQYDEEDDEEEEEYSGSESGVESN